MWHAIYAIISVISGWIVGAFLGWQPILILRFGLPVSRQWLQQGVFTSAEPIRKYKQSLLLTTALFAVVVSIGAWILDTEWFVGGTAFMFLWGLLKSPQNADNLADFVEGNADDMEWDRFEQHLSGTPGAEAWHQARLRYEGQRGSRMSDG